MKTVYRRVVLLVVAGVLSACQHSDSDEHRDSAEGRTREPVETREAIDVTTWTQDTELLVEFRGLVVGHDSPFTAHLTWLDGFQGVASGQVTVVLSGGGVADERFVSGPSATAGIFVPVVRPEHAMERKVTVILEADGTRAEHVLGTFAVLASPPEEPPSEPEDDGGAISFLKGQQWKMAFSTEIVATRALRPSFSAYGTLIPRADGEVLVSAPATGRLVATKAPLPVVGSQVESGDVLARLVPRLEGTADVASLDLAVAAARLDIEHFVRERERLEGLLSDGAVPERRVTEARHAEAAARAAMKAAKRRTGQFRRVQRAGGRGAQAGIDVRTPLSGSVLEVNAVAGSFVEDGAPLFRVIDQDVLWLSARVPEIDAALVREAVGAWFQVPGTNDRVEVGSDALVTRGGIVDPKTRTVSVVFSVPNESRALRVGARVQVHLIVGEGALALAVPSKAVLVDATLEYVFVQIGGESFERRQVRTGTRDGEIVEILGGVAAGERVVVDGAYAVKLASASTTPPAHGHAH